MAYKPGEKGGGENQVRSAQSSKTCGGIFHTLYYNIIIERVPEKKATSDFVINYWVPDSFPPIFVWYLPLNSACKGKILHYVEKKKICSLSPHILSILLCTQIFV